MRTRHFSLRILTFAAVLFALLCLGVQKPAFAAGDDRLYYFNMSSTAEGNFILVESDGHWGLIDAGHSYADTVKDADGAYLPASQANGLSSQISCRNGRDAANYMVTQLGVTHLDFIVGTHAHSDHIGGMAEVASTTYADASGNLRYLVDGNTTYYYKEYHHISDLEDDLVSYSENSWHNQAFVSQALEAMLNRGVSTVDVSRQQVQHGDPGNSYGDYITFQMGDMSFRLYNLYSGNDENANSIVTVITNGEYDVVSLADINIINGAIDNTAVAIGKDFGNVDVVVAGHHGYSGSNTKKMFDTLQPDFVIVSNGNNANIFTSYDFAAALPYAQEQFGTNFFTTAMSQHAIVTDLSGNSVWVYDLKDDGSMTDAFYTAIQASRQTGWVSWVNTDTVLWSYLENGVPVKNCWKYIGNGYYYFYDDGIMAANTWVGEYYVDASGVWVPGFDANGAYGWVVRAGRRSFRFYDGTWAQGWLLLDGNWYYFGEDKWVKTGWQTIDNNRYFFYDNGVLAANTWIGEYYVGESGAWIPDYWNPGWHDFGDGWKAYRSADGTSWVNGWQFIDNAWYYFQNNWMLRGWNTVDGKRYFFYDNGRLAQNTWVGQFYVDEAGVWDDVWRTGWYDFPEGRAYRAADGRSWVNGWQFINNSWYYFQDNWMLTGWNTVDDKRYFFYDDGRMAADAWIGEFYVDADGVWIPDYWKPGWYTFPEGKAYRAADGRSWVNGWQFIDNAWYYFRENWMLTGWQTIDDKRYFFYDNGKMAQNTWVGDFFVSESGAWEDVWRSGWYTFPEGVAYRLADGLSWANGWQWIGNSWYYFQDQWMLTGWNTVDGKRYFFYDDGRMAADAWIGDYYVDASGAWVEGAVKP